MSKPQIARPEDVERILEPTPEKLEEIRREQLKLYRSRARLTDAERRVMRGIELEEHHRLTGDRDGLAEALALQGRYEEAAREAMTPMVKQSFEEKARAVVKPDEDCSCDSFRQDGDYNLPNQYVEFYGHSNKHGGEVPFIRCLVCGELNAFPLPSHLARVRQIASEPDTPEKKKFFKNR